MVVNVKKPMVFINPTMISLTDEVVYKEACLSFPNKYINTNRYKWVNIKADNFEQHYDCGGSMVFGPIDEHMNDDGQDPDGLLEGVCIQHEFDHLRSPRRHAALSADQANREGALWHRRLYQLPLRRQSH